MGKSLVIKGADFSENGIQETTPTLNWYIDSTLNTGSLSSANRANGGWAFKEGDMSLLQGKTINRLKLIPSIEGTLNLYKATSLSGPVTLVASILIPDADVNTISVYEFNGFTLGENEVLVIGEANSSAGFKYKTDAGNGFYSKVPSNPSASGVLGLNISVGYYGI